MAADGLEISCIRFSTTIVKIHKKVTKDFPTRVLIPKDFPTRVPISKNFPTRVPTANDFPTRVLITKDFPTRVPTANDFPTRVLIPKDFSYFRIHKESGHQGTFVHYTNRWPMAADGLEISRFRFSTTIGRPLGDRRSFSEIRVPMTDSSA